MSLGSFHKELRPKSVTKSKKSTSCLKKATEVSLRTFLTICSVLRLDQELQLHAPLASVIPSLNSSDWYAALNLQNACFHLTTHPSHRKYLKFVGLHCQYTVLLFGLSSALRVFTKCMAVGAAHLRNIGIQVFPYLDN